MAFTANSKFLLVTFKIKNYPKHRQIFNLYAEQLNLFAFLQLKLSLNMDMVV